MQILLFYSPINYHSIYFTITYLSIKLFFPTRGYKRRLKSKGLAIQGMDPNGQDGSSCPGRGKPLQGCKGMQGPAEVQESRSVQPQIGDCFLEEAAFGLKRMSGSCQTDEGGRACRQRDGTGTGANCGFGRSIGWGRVARAPGRWGMGQQGVEE